MRLVASGFLVLCSPQCALQVAVIIYACDGGPKVGKKGLRQEAPGESRDANLGLPEREGPGCWLLGWSLRVKGKPRLQGSGDGTWPVALRTLFLTVCPRGFGGLAIITNASTFMIWGVGGFPLPGASLDVHLPLQDCLSKHEPSPAVTDRCTLPFPHCLWPSPGQSGAVSPQNTLDICSGRALWTPLTFLAGDPDPWAKA